MVCVTPWMHIPKITIILVDIWWHRKWLYRGWTIDAKKTIGLLQMYSAYQDKAEDIACHSVYKANHHTDSSIFLQNWAVSSRPTQGHKFSLGDGSHQTQPSFNTLLISPSIATWPYSMTGSTQRRKCRLTKIIYKNDYWTSKHQPKHLGLESCY